MDLSALIKKIHFLISAKEERHITQLEMSERIGVKKRTYVEYFRGGNTPKAMIALLNILAQLEDDDIVRIVRSWQRKKDA